VRFTVTDIHIEAGEERKPSMSDLSPAWDVQPDFVRLDHAAWISNVSGNATAPLIPHIIHQVSYVI